VWLHAHGKQLQYKGAVSQHGALHQNMQNSSGGGQQQRASERAGCKLGTARTSAWRLPLDHPKK
jgi:hypothetical protein